MGTCGDVEIAQANLHSCTSHATAWHYTSLSAPAPPPIYLYLLLELCLFSTLRLSALPLNFLFLDLLAASSGSSLPSGPGSEGSVTTQLMATFLEG